MGETLGGDLARASDDDLLALIGEGEAAAFRELTERHVDRAYAVAFRIMGNGADAEDVVQDAFLKVWSLRGSWEQGRASFSTWLYRVITNRCIDLKRRPVTGDIDAVTEEPSAPADQVQTLMRDEASSRLVAAMAKLPAQQRLALMFSYFENLSNSEIATVMETTVMAVESLLKRGRQQLRDVLRKDGPDMINSFRAD